MLDRLPAVPAAAGPIRLFAAYRSAESLLRELSRAISQGQTLLKADSGLPAGTRLVMVMSTPSLSAPIEVHGTVTHCRPQGQKMAMRLRYHFDAAPQRRRLREAMAELQPRHARAAPEAPRAPLALHTEAKALVRGLSATVHNASRTGARLELVGRRPAGGGLGRPTGDAARGQPARHAPAGAPRARSAVGGQAAAHGGGTAAGGRGPLPSGCRRLCANSSARSCASTTRGPHCSSCGSWVRRASAAEPHQSDQMRRVIYCRAVPAVLSLGPVVGAVSRPSGRV